MTGETVLRPVVAVVGLGQMGLGMAGVLVDKGLCVIGADPNTARQAAAHARGVEIADRPEVYGKAPVILLSLPTAAIVSAVVGAVLDVAGQGSVIVDTSTSEAAVSRRLAAEARAKGVGFLDAPVSGGPAGAAAGTLTMMIGGEADDLARALPVLSAISAKRLHVGGPGAGNVAKLVNNFLVGAHLLAAAEAVRMAEGAGVPAADALAVVSAASGRSAVSEVNFPRWVLNGAFDSGFTMGLMRKDMRLALDLARSVGAAGPFAEQVGALWAESAGRLADGEDFNRIVEPLTPKPAP